MLCCRKAADTRSAGRSFGQSLRAGDVVVLSGALGAGKTVFVQGVAEALGISEAVTSPSFTLMSEYRGTMPLYHLDLYRLDSPEEFVWLGVEEMLNGKGVCLIEWGRKAENELPERSKYIDIDIEADGMRIITLWEPA
ncbi:MAG: tRNA (adenosine(37)-N6)-threonylcarbamoyltransferase complex ATPase subunit type 1 TsaE [Spirochaeta sp. LUC14_002_19_P3]|nr:MAG: tRNA (adenosine(37)-N6)-threonylcarbamoyltransferase complex ATPase subunit type 1 TsaE [Spirochaeta sp. LUC14_002_19_P3]